MKYNGIKNIKITKKSKHDMQTEPEKAVSKPEKAVSKPEKPQKH